MAREFLNDSLSEQVSLSVIAKATGLPPYDDALLRRELALFPDWCVKVEYGITWTPEQTTTWQRLCDVLVASDAANFCLSEAKLGLLECAIERLVAAGSRTVELTSFVSPRWIKTFNLSGKINGDSKSIRF